MELFDSMDLQLQFCLAANMKKTKQLYHDAPICWNKGRGAAARGGANWQIFLKHVYAIFKPLCGMYFGVRASGSFQSFGTGAAERRGNGWQ